MVIRPHRTGPSSPAFPHAAEAGRRFAAGPRAGPPDATGPARGILLAVAVSAFAWVGLALALPAIW